MGRIFNTTSKHRRVAPIAASLALSLPLGVGIFTHPRPRGTDAGIVIITTTGTVGITAHRP